MFGSIRFAAFLACVSLCGSLASASDVLVVGPGGFANIGAAVAAAQDGDVILVRIPVGGPPFPAIDVTGKSLTIVADSNTQLVRLASVVVHDVPLGKTVLLSGLDVTGASTFVPTVQGVNIAGHLRLLSCNSLGKAGTNNFTHPAATPAATIKTSSGSTAMASCALTGGLGGHQDEYPGYPGGSALEVTDAVAATFGSTLTGGQGGPIKWLLDTAGRGGRGALVTRTASTSRLLMANSALQGGRGGADTFCGTIYSYAYRSGDGGAGLELGSGTSALRQATTITGGQEGSSPSSCGYPGSPGEDFANNGGTLQVNPVPALKLTAPKVLREGASITLTFDGANGDRITLLLGHKTAFRERNDGVVLIGAPVSRYFMGTIGPSGSLSVTTTVPALPVGDDAENVWIQALAWHTNGTLTLGNFAVVTVLDSSL